MMPRAVRVRIVEEQRGFSLPELIIAIAITSIVMTMVVSMFSMFTSTFTEERSLTDSVNVAGVGMNETTRVIRAGTIIDRTASSDLPVFVSANRESVILYSYLADDSIDPAPLMIEMAIDTDRQLVEKRWTATRNSSDEWVFPAITSPPDKSRVIARKILAPTTTQLAAGELYLFTYLTTTGAVINAPVSGADLASIAAVKVTMIVQADETGRAQPVKLQNRVGIPNLTASRLGLNG